MSSSHDRLPACPKGDREDVPVRVIQLDVVAAAARHHDYGFFGVLYSTSFWNGFQMVS